MGFFKKSPPPPVLPLDSPKPPGGRTRLVIAKGSLDFEVVGLGFREDAVKAAAGRRPAGEDWVERRLVCQLLREPYNMHDRNAVAVWAGKHGHIGYISKDDAVIVAPALDRAIQQVGERVDIECTATIESTWDEYDDDKFEWAGSEVTIHLDVQMKATTKPASRE